MMQDTEEENRLPSEEAEGKSQPDHASVETNREQTNAVRVDQRDGHSAVHLTRRGLLGHLAVAVGGKQMSELAQGPLNGLMEWVGNLPFAGP